jgi:hypothetical protein
VRKVRIDYFYNRMARSRASLPNPVAAGDREKEL